MIGVTSTLFYSISFSSSSIANWVHAVLARFCVLEGVMFPEQSTLPNTYYRAKQQNKPLEF